jgi:hypothetical protein
MKSILLFSIFIQLITCQLCNVADPVLLQSNLQVVGSLLVNGYTNSSDFYATNCAIGLCNVAAIAANNTIAINGGSICQQSTCVAIQTQLSNASSTYFNAYVSNGSPMLPNSLTTIIYNVLTANTDSGYSVITGLYTNPGSTYFAEYDYTVNMYNVSISTTGGTVWPIYLTCGIYKGAALYGPLLTATSATASNALILSNSGVISIVTTLSVRCTVSPLPGTSTYTITGTVPVTGTFSMRRINF